LVKALSSVWKTKLITKEVSMIKFITSVLAVLIVLSIALNMGDKIRSGAEMIVIANSPVKTVVVNEVYERDPILDYDFTLTEWPAPPRYQPPGMINPFIPVVNEKPRVEVAKVILPDTPFTKYMTSQLTLTGIVINSSSGYAFFTLPNNGKSYKAAVGDYIGRKGVKISSIVSGGVHMSDGNVIAMPR